MTGMRGGSVSPPASVRPPSAAGAADRSSIYLSKLPSNAPECVASSTVHVTDPTRVWPWNKEERRRRFNLLVRRYKNQLLYGCQEPNCLTPTCLSYRRRVTEGPLRKFTELSARTLACYLASQDDPEKGLCYHPPSSPSDFSCSEVPRPAKKRLPRVSPNIACATDAEQSGAIHASDDDKFPVRRSLEIDVMPQGTPPQSISSLGNGKREQSAVETLANAGNHASQDALAGHGNGGQILKDPKSFSQNLFDTLSLRMVEWLPLRRAAGALNPLFISSSTQERSASTGDQTPATSQRKPRPRKTSSVKETSKPKSGPQSLNSTGSAVPAALEVKLPGQHVKRVSLSELEHWRPPNSWNVAEERPKPDRKPVRQLSLNSPSHTSPLFSVPSPPALKHRPQKNRQMNGDLDTIVQTDKKQHRRVSWDGSKASKPSQRASDHGDGDRTRKTKWPDSPATATDRAQRRRWMRNSFGNIDSVQSVSHLSGDILTGLHQMMFESDEDAEKWRVEMEGMEMRGSFETCEWQFATPRQRQAFPFIAQSVFFVLSNPAQLLKSFQKSSGTNGSGDSKRSILDVVALENSFRSLFALCPWEIALHSLWIALEKLFVPPRELSTTIQHRRRQSISASGSVISKVPSPAAEALHADSYIPDADAADVFTIILFALASAIPQTDADTWHAIRQIRASGTTLPDADLRNATRRKTRKVVKATDRFEHDLALRLVNRLVRALAARLAFNEISKAYLVREHELEQQRKSNVMTFILANFREHHSLVKQGSSQSDPRDEQVPPSVSAVSVEWIRSFLLKEWDGKPAMPKSSSTGGAVQLLRSLYKDRAKLGLTPEDFHTSFLSERLDPLEMPVEWLGFPFDNKNLHLLSYSFLFPPSALVTYFRALNYATMSKSYETAMTTSRHVTQTAFSSTIPVYDDVGLLARLRTSMSTYLVLVVRRDNVLADSLNQLWRREKRELMRPLKVQMGMEEGEEGIDHGGVQQEFFRVVLAEALDPKFGMFTLDGRNHVSWFQPGSLEPLYKFELLGLLVSLAIYNGLTLPLNFPVAMYRKLLGLKVKHIDHIRTGWPELAKGLDDLLSWSDGDVGDIFMRTYEFSFEAFGSVVAADMERVGRDATWPVPQPITTRNRMGSGSFDRSSSYKARRCSKSSRGISTLHDEVGTSSTLAESYPSGILKDGGSRSIKTPNPSTVEEASLVTNENRRQFVKDYLFWLTDKSIRPQYEAFARGFYTCLDRTALSIFTPEALKTVVEGSQEIDIGELEQHARYEGGFDASHRVIRDFWSVVRDYSPEERGSLLEFVTASDRVPVNGIGSIMFVIQKNGVGDSRLPTSLTCFGRLLLPEYSSRETLKDKLGRALENAQGFGVA